MASEEQAKRALIRKMQRVTFWETHGRLPRAGELESMNTPDYLNEPQMGAML